MHNNYCTHFLHVQEHIKVHNRIRLRSKYYKTTIYGHNITYKYENGCRTATQASKPEMIAWWLVDKTTSYAISQTLYAKKCHRPKSIEFKLCHPHKCSPSSLSWNPSTSKNRNMTLRFLSNFMFKSEQNQQSTSVTFHLHITVQLQFKPYKTGNPWVRIATTPINNNWIDMHLYKTVSISSIRDHFQHTAQN